MNLFKVLFHLAPVYPLFWQGYYLSLAFLLLVAMPYIKIKKLTINLEDADDSQKPSLERARDFWRKFVFKEF